MWVINATNLLLNSWIQIPRERMVMNAIETTQPNQSSLEGAEKAFARKTLRQHRHLYRVLVPSMLLLVIKVSNPSPFFFIYVTVVPVPYSSNFRTSVEFLEGCRRCHGVYPLPKGGYIRKGGRSSSPYSTRSSRRSTRSLLRRQSNSRGRRDMRPSIRGPSSGGALAGEGLAGTASAGVDIRHRHIVAGEGSRPAGGSLLGAGRSSEAGIAAAGCSTGSQTLWMRVCVVFKEVW